jgi:hypothetical protein
MSSGILKFEMHSWINHETISLVALQNLKAISTSSSIIDYARLIMLVPTTLQIGQFIRVAIVVVIVW